MAHQSYSGIVRTAAFATVALLASSPCYAYLDPGTGSIILQSALAGIAVAIGFLRFYWDRFKAFLSSLTGNASSEADLRDEQNIAPESDTGNST